MPQLSDISYSREACIKAVRDYYDFLTKLYLDPSYVIEPPQGGWPTITADVLEGLGKTDEVISLLRHLPYIRRPNDDRRRAQGAAWCYFADWQFSCSNLVQGRVDLESLKICSEDYPLCEDCPPHVVGLTMGARDNPVFLLDTELGIVHWAECYGEIHHVPSREKVEDDPYDYAPENEAEWRADAPAWAVADFFEILKDQFRQLKFIPVSPIKVIDVYAIFGDDADGMIPMLQDIYREYGWPDLETYRKEECLSAVQAALLERYPKYSSDLYPKGGEQ